MSAKGKYVNNSAKDGGSFRLFKPEICASVDGKKGGPGAAFCT